MSCRVEGAVASGPEVRDAHRRARGAEMHAAAAYLQVVLGLAAVEDEGTASTGNHVFHQCAGKLDPALFRDLAALVRGELVEDGNAVAHSDPLEHRQGRLVYPLDLVRTERPIEIDLDSTADDLAEVLQGLFACALAHRAASAPCPGSLLAHRGPLFSLSPVRPPRSGAPAATPATDARPCAERIRPGKAGSVRPRAKSPYPARSGPTRQTPLLLHASCPRHR